MIPVWAFVVACVVFLGILGNEYRTIKNLQDDLTITQFYLDRYVSAYGSVISVDLLASEGLDDRESKR